MEFHPKTESSLSLLHLSAFFHVLHSNVIMQAAVRIKQVMYHYTDTQHENDTSELNCVSHIVNLLCCTANIILNKKINKIER